MTRACWQIWGMRSMPDKILKVLLADDEPDVLTIMARKLKEAGFAVVTAADGQEASDQLKAEAPDILVLDVTMPRKNGFEVLAELRAVPAAKLGRWVPVIIVSAQGELEDMRKGFDLQADHYLIKPCKMDELVGAVRLMASLIPLRNPQ